MGSNNLIKENFEKFFEWAEKAFNAKEYNVAVTLYFKGLAEICDYVLWREHRKIGASHSERFRLLEKTSPELYGIADELFTYYRDTYSKKINESTAREVKKGVENAIRISGIRRES